MTRLSLSDKLYGFPWPLFIVSDNPWTPSMTCIRTDIGMPWRGFYHRAKYKVRRNYMTFKGRLIRTFAVWELAERKPAYVPQWTDIYIVRYLCVKIKSILKSKDRHGKDTTEIK